MVRIHEKSISKCHAVVRDVVRILRRNLGTAFFHYDAALVRDSCFFAGFLLASENGSREDVEVCLTALSEMRWAFSKSDERQRTIRLICDAGASPRGQSSRSFSSSPSEETIRGPGTFGGSYVGRALMEPTSVPPISLSATTTGSGYDSPSAPNNACTSDGRWTFTASASGSESEPYSASSRSPSSAFSESYAQSSHSTLSLSNVFCPNGDCAVGPSSLAHPAGGQSTTTYYVPPYNYSRMGDLVVGRLAPAQFGSMDALSPSEPAPALSHPTAGFDYAAAVSYPGQSAMGV